MDNGDSETGFLVLKQSFLFSLQIYFFFFLFFTGATTVGLGLLHGFVIMNYSEVESLALRSTPNLEDLEPNFV
jgi:hypothetical protein